MQTTFYIFNFRLSVRKNEELIEITPIEKQVLDSTYALEKLCAEGEEVVRVFRYLNK